MVQFCVNCENMLYPKEIDKELYMCCLNCGFKDKNNDLVIFSKIYNDTTTLEDTINNRYIVYDKRLPRTTKKRCQNKDCPSRTDKSKQCAVIETIKKTREKIYVCCECFTDWKYT